MSDERKRRANLNLKSSIEAKKQVVEDLREQRNNRMNEKKEQAYR